jgi:6-phosphogluconolactonase (cycloisomerase 2 family)
MSLELDLASGVPHELPTSPASPERFLYAVVTDPAERFVFTAEPDPGGHIDSYRIGADGSIAETPNSALDLDEGPISLAVDPGGNFAYVGTFDDHALRVFAIDADTGALTPVGDPIVLDTTPSFVVIDPTGRFLYGSHGLTAGIHGFRIGQGGALQALDGSPFGATSVRAGAMVFSPGGARLYASGQALYAFSVDATSGALAEIEGSPFSTDIASDAFAANIAIEPRGEYLYTTAFLTTRHVSGYAIDPESGALAPVPRLPLQTSAPYSLAVDPSGRFVYVGNDFGDLSVFSIDRRDGSLDELDDSPFPIGGLQPQFAFARR